ncbi:PREDICTED: zinc phosphodiesterase ELAC protein 1-like isoform X2 [Amphimedon queenslandica]|nr:PREDICTED: zinc phosphodiesterase ELAC protein 1-like isoform X2 [Amphimedon queenslandica]|eukprot:XP_019854534.1 PREDICTED: zinc phosphodiesterase ELAC protein 1-like isoform X2 [Amphimedon queenslandica]
MRSTVRLGRITKIFITHLHGDHLFGLPGLLCTINQNADRCHIPVDIYGPYGLCHYLRTTLSLSRSFLAFKYRVHELLTDTNPSDIDGINWNPHYVPDSVLHPNEMQPCQIRPNASGVWEVCISGPLKVLAGHLKHRVTTFGYVTIEDDIPGKLQVERLKELGIPPGPIYGKLKKGETVITPSGNTITPSDVIGPSEKGRKIVILGDTCDSYRIAEIAKNADVLVHEATNENSHFEKCVENGHSTPSMAAEFALSIGARKLILTHFSQRYKDLNEELEENEESVEKLLKEAQEIFGNEVYVASDFKTFNVPLHRN